MWYRDIECSAQTHGIVGHFELRKVEVQRWRCTIPRCQYWYWTAHTGVLKLVLDSAQITWGAPTRSPEAMTTRRETT
eukprot:3820313-Rhodomonas_salina.2